MSRLSRPNFKGRESIFHGGPEQYYGDSDARCPPDLEECVMAMEDCCEEMYEAQVLLRSGTKDLPRISKVLQTERVFLLVNDLTVKKYKTALTEEVEPTISDLIERAEQGLAALEKKEHMLRTKSEAAKARAKPGIGQTAAHKMDARRLQTLTRQRERLEMEVRNLEAEILDLDLRSSGR